MKKIHAFIVLELLAVALPLSAPAQPVSATDSAPTQVHNGFYFNVTVGPSYNNYEITGSGNTLKTDGAGASVSFLVYDYLGYHTIYLDHADASTTYIGFTVSFN